jgi:glycogen operon protein
MGNNNAYCQNNFVSWFDWDLLTKNSALRRFVAALIRLRKRFAMSASGSSLSLAEFLAQARIDWHGVRLFSPDLSEDSHTLAATAYIESGPAFHLMLNAFWEPLNFAVPAAPEKASWVRVLDTFLPSPKDITDAPTDAVTSSYLVQPRSTVLLMSHPAPVS